MTRDDMLPRLAPGEFRIMPFLTTACFGPLPQLAHAHQLRKHPLPSIEELRRRYRYDPASDQIINRFGRVVRGGIQTAGYRQVSVGGKAKILYHRLKHALIHGEYPHEIDHEDGDISNNDPSNLRNGSHAANMQNRVAGRIFRRVLKSGAIRWQVRVEANGIRKAKTFANFCDAVKYRDELLASRSSRSFR